MKKLSDEERVAAKSWRLRSCLGAILLPLFTLGVAFIVGRASGSEEPEVPDLVGRVLLVMLSVIPFLLGVWLRNWGKLVEDEFTRKIEAMESPPEVAYNPSHGLYYLFSWGAFAGGAILFFMALKHLFTG